MTATYSFVRVGAWLWTYAPCSDCQVPTAVVRLTHHHPSLLLCGVCIPANALAAAYFAGHDAGPQMRRLLYQTFPTARHQIAMRRDRALPELTAAQLDLLTRLLRPVKGAEL